MQKIIERPVLAASLGQRGDSKSVLLQNTESNVTGKIGTAKKASIEYSLAAQNIIKNGYTKSRLIRANLGILIPRKTYKTQIAIIEPKSIFKSYIKLVIIFTIGRNTPITVKLIIPPITII